MKTTPKIDPPSDHYVNKRAKTLLDRYTGTREKRQRISDELLEASQYTLMFNKFKKHRLALISFYLMIGLYLVAIFADFVAPYNPNLRFQNQIYSSPSRIRVVDVDGKWQAPFVYGRESVLDKTTYTYQFVENTDEKYPLRLLVKGEPYTMWGILPGDIHLFGIESETPLFLLGSDHLGRDLLSRIIYASRISMFIGFAGVMISYFLGVLLGGLSGFFGGVVDIIIQRAIEFVMSVPQIPLWMGLAAAIPREWSGIQTFFAITVILSLVGWTGLARVVRGKIISLREEDYVTAAKVSSASNLAIIFKHLLPGFTSYLIVHITISIPGMILGETTLSFLGLGITPPDMSWGSLLQQANDVTVINFYPWLLYPGVAIILAVVLFNFIGDGLRDAADPYSR